MGLHVSAVLSKCTSCCFKVKFQNFRLFVCSTLEKWQIVWSNAQTVCEMIKLSKPVRPSIPFRNISFLSEIEWKPVVAMLSNPKPKHLSSSSPECPIRANVIAHIIMCGVGADFIAVFTSSAQWRSNWNDSITPIRLDNDFDVGSFCLVFLIASWHHLLPPPASYLPFSTLLSTQIFYSYFLKAFLHVL